jgi:hypothetical protein
LRRRPNPPPPRRGPDPPPARRGPDLPPPRKRRPDPPPPRRIRPGLGRGRHVRHSRSLPRAKEARSAHERHRKEHHVDGEAAGGIGA